MHTDRGWLVAMVLPTAVVFLAFFALPMAPAICHWWFGRTGLGRVRSGFY